MLLSLCGSGEVLEDHMDAHEEVRAFMTDPVLQQRLAKYLVCLLDINTLGLRRGVGRRELLQAMNGHIQAETQCMGRFQRR